VVLILVLLINALLSCDVDPRVDAIPGKFVVVWNDSLHAPRFNNLEKAYYDHVTLNLYRDNTFEFNFDFERRGVKSGIWKLDGPKGKRLLHIKYENSGWKGISYCLDTGWTFSYPIQILDNQGFGRSLTFKKVENFK
jgi:hypothetical protein